LQFIHLIEAVQQHVFKGLTINGTAGRCARARSDRAGKLARLQSLDAERVRHPHCLRCPAEPETFKAAPLRRTRIASTAIIPMFHASSRSVAEIMLLVTSIAVTFASYARDASIASTISVERSTFGYSTYPF